MNAEHVAGCLLRKTRENSADQCLDDCGGCGWNDQVETRRKREIRRKMAKPAQRKVREVRCPYCQARISVAEVEP